MNKENKMLYFRESEPSLASEISPIDEIRYSLQRLSSELPALSKENNGKGPDSKFNRYYEVTTGALNLRGHDGELYSDTGLAVTQGTRIRVDTDAGTTRLDGQGDIEFWHVYVEATDEHPEAEGYMSSRHMRFVENIQVDETMNFQGYSARVTSSRPLTLRTSTGDPYENSPGDVAHGILSSTEVTVTGSAQTLPGLDGQFFPVRLADSRRGFMSAEHLELNLEDRTSAEVLLVSQEIASNVPELEDRRLEASDRPHDISTVEGEEVLEEQSELRRTLDVGGVNNPDMPEGFDDAIVRAEDMLHEVAEGIDGDDETIVAFWDPASGEISVFEQSDMSLISIRSIPNLGAGNIARFDFDNTNNPVVRTLNGRNSIYRHENPNLIPVGSIYWTSSENTPSETIYMVPFSPIFDTPELRARGLDFLDDSMQEAMSRLEGVHSRAFPDRLITDLITPEFITSFLFMEQTDGGALKEYLSNSAHDYDGHLADLRSNPMQLELYAREYNRLLVRLALNGDRAFATSSSRVGARGATQFMPLSYEETVHYYNERPRQPRADHYVDLIPDFEEGTADFVNSLTATACYLDRILEMGRHSNRDRSDWYQDHPDARYNFIAVAYNRGAGGTNSLIDRTGEEWINRAPNEAYYYTIKLGMIDSVRSESVQSTLAAAREERGEGVHDEVDPWRIIREEL